jgi:hypothetical protein
MAIGGLDVPFLAPPTVVFPPIAGTQKRTANVGDDSIKDCAAHQHRTMLA